MTTMAKPMREMPAVERTARASLQITVLMGGPSAEREVSLSSGKAVARALESLGHRVRCEDISPSQLAALTYPADIVFIALHGTFGADGQVQQLLEERGIPYVGSGPESSARAMNKLRTKLTLLEQGIPTPPYVVVDGQRPRGDVACWKLPAVVKPICEGSSVDCQIVRHPGQVCATIDRLVRKYGQCLVEDYIRGPELTVSVLGERALPVCQIVPKREFYDYRAKYQDEATEYLFEPQLPADLLTQVQAYSVQAHQALGCRDFSRVDWMVERETLRPFCLEVNTIPGFTDHSLLPKAAARIGLDMAALCQEIVETALRRRPK